VKISIREVKEALQDPDFRKKISVDLTNFLKSPNCPCHNKLFRMVANDFKKELQERKSPELCNCDFHGE
jgi:hypothetical protein